MIDLTAERRLYDATTQGEWRADKDGIWIDDVTYPFSVVRIFDNEGGADVTLDMDAEDGEFIAHAHNQYPALLAEIDKGREAQRMLEEARAVARAFIEIWTDRALSRDECIEDIESLCYDRLRTIAGEGETHER